jgi:uncharacterized protein YybS (DUF2232 family)
VNTVDDDGKQARAIVEGARMVSMTVLLSILSIIIPGFGTVFTYLIPTPIALCVIRHDVKLGILASMAAALAAAFIGSPFHACLIVIGFGIVGVAIGEGIRSGLSLKQTLICSVCVAFLSKMLLAAVVWGLMGREFAEIFSAMLREGREIFAAVNAPYGLTFDDIVAMFIRVLPALLIGSSLFETAVNYMLVTSVMQRLEMKVKALSPFSSWRFSPRLLYVYIFGLILIALNVYYSNDIAAIVGLNVVVVMSQLYFVQGISLIWFIADQYRLNKGIRWLLAILGLILGIFSVVVFVGVFDSLLNVRRFFWRPTSNE